MDRLLKLCTSVVIMVSASLIGCSANEPENKPVNGSVVSEVASQPEYTAPEDNEVVDEKIPDKVIQEEVINEEETSTEEIKEPTDEEPTIKNFNENAIPAESANLPASAPIQPTKTSESVGYNDRKSWWFKRNSTNTPPSAQMDINIAQYGGYYLGNTDEKIIYLTFDEGYENGFTPKILDVLKNNDVKAAFFVTKPYMESDPDLIKRMVYEGHIVGNHSVSHPDMTTISDEKIFEELNECAKYFEELTGKSMPTFFRPPEGVYSVRTLEKTQEAGYKTIFWSYAYKDWDTKNQPGKQGAFDMAVNNYHNGAIMLLHAVSQSNTEALEDIIVTLKEKGYSFASLDELP